MTVRTAARTRRPEPRPAPAAPAAPADPADPALDDALAHIGVLAERLWAVRRLHAPAPRRWGPPRCSGCGHAVPCPTVRAASPA